MDVKILIFLIVRCYGFENVALEKTATMSSSEYTNKWLAGAAVDGNTSQEMESGTCALTSTNSQAVAWWRVDLGRVYSLSNISIFYRDDQSNPLTYRLREVQVQTTNNIHVKGGNWKSCFRFSTTTWPSSISSVPCLSLARYVRLYKDKRSTCKAPVVNLDNCAILELCEVQIFGCSLNEYGDNCDPCPDRCLDGHCDIMSGICSQCKPGYIGGHCEQTCTDGLYGPGCNQRCSVNCRGGNMYCNKVNGICINGCEDGWSDVECNEMCIPGTYGNMCKGKCGHCRKGTTCHHANGTCLDGCETDWEGRTCTEQRNKDIGHANCSASQRCNETCQGDCYRGVTETNGVRASVAEETSDNSIKMALYFGVPGAVLIVSLIAVVIVVARIKCKKQHVKDRVQQPVVDTSQPAYANTDEVGGRHVNDEGLVYVDVNFATSNKQKKKKENKTKKRKYEKTEYASVAVSPYAVSQL